MAIGFRLIFLDREKTIFTFRDFKTKLSAAIAVLLSISFTSACTNKETQFQQAVASYQAGDYNQAFELFQVLAEQGDAESQFVLGMLYDDGEGVKQNYQQAAEWYQKAANQGHAMAQYNLGILYQFGLGVAEDDKRCYGFKKRLTKGLLPLNLTWA